MRKEYGGILSKTPDFQVANRIKASWGNGTSSGEKKLAHGRADPRTMGQWKSTDELKIKRVKRDEKQPRSGRTWRGEIPGGDPLAGERQVRGGKGKEKHGRRGEPDLEGLDLFLLDTKGLILNPLKRGPLVYRSGKGKKQIVSAKPPMPT